MNDDRQQPAHHCCNDDKEAAARCATSSSDAQKKQSITISCIYSRSVTGTLDGLRRCDARGGHCGVTQRSRRTTRRRRRLPGLTADVRDVIAIEFEPRRNAANSTTTYLLLRQQSDVDRASKVLPVSIRSCGKRSGLGKAYRCVCGGGGGNALSVYCGWRR